MWGNGGGWGGMRTGLWFGGVHASGDHKSVCGGGSGEPCGALGEVGRGLTLVSALLPSCRVSPVLLDPSAPLVPPDFP